MKKRNLTCFLLCLLILPAVLCGCGGGGKQPAPGSGIQTEEIFPDFEGIHLGSGLILESLAAATGSFPEDGSDTSVTDILAASFANHGDAALQYAQILVNVNDVVYTFEISSLPAGESLYAFNLNRLEAPEKADSVEARAEYLTFFQEEPSTETNRLQVTFSEDRVYVKNISGMAINQDISVYYKTAVDGVYMGGITYRIRVGTMEAGQEINGYSSHASEDSKLMFITYGS